MRCTESSQTAAARGRFFVNRSPFSGRLLCTIRSTVFGGPCLGHNRSDPYPKVTGSFLSFFFFVKRVDQSALAGLASFWLLEAATYIRIIVVLLGSPNSMTNNNHARRNQQQHRPTNNFTKIDQPQLPTTLRLLSWPVVPAQVAAPLPTAVAGKHRKFSVLAAVLSWRVHCCCGWCGFVLACLGRPLVGRQVLCITRACRL